MATSGFGHVTFSVTSLLRLLPPAPEGSLVAVTSAVFFTLGHAAAVAVTVTSTDFDAPPAIVPRSQVTFWPAIVQPGALVIARPAANVSVAVTPVASALPRFSALSVNVTEPFALTVAALADFVIVTSGVLQVTLTEAESVLSPALVSSVAVTVPVLSTDGPEAPLVVTGIA